MNDFEAKQQRRAERYRELAEKNANEATSRGNSPNVKAVIGMQGEPVKIGHHSERKHRRLLEKADQDMRKSIEADKKAEYYREKAASVGTGGISSDDPEALQKLREKLHRLEKRQKELKEINKIVRSQKDDPEKIEAITQLGVKKETAEMVLQPDYAGRVGIPAYAMQNNNANIRRIKKRIKEMEAASEGENKNQKVGDVEIIENVELNRLQIVFPDKPAADIRELLKRNGFRWSRTNGAWQRQLNDRARYHLKLVIAGLNDEG